jgi:dihydrofolate reductase
VHLTLPSISYVVARSSPGNVIGIENRLPWHLRTDLKRFKEITSGHAIIMGRKTYLSIGRPLPNRVNIILSRTAEYPIENDFWKKTETSVVWAGSLATALFFADVVSIAREQKDFFVIGGSEMYSIFLRLFNKIYLTEVLTGKKIAGDATFPFRIDERRWRTIVDEKYPVTPHDEYPSRYRILERKRRWVRYVEVNDFFTEREGRDFWLARQLDLFKDTKPLSERTPRIIPYQYKLFKDQAAA